MLRDVKPGDARAGRCLAYADPQYAASLQEFGVPFELARSGGWALRRPIPGTSWFDAMGCYPLFSCRDWSQLCADVDSLPSDLVSLTLVTDPFGAPAADQLLDTFDIVRPYKDHFLIDLDRPRETTVARHHRKSARKALQLLTIETCDPIAELATWRELYGHIVAKHQVTGIQAFSPTAFSIQARIEGLVGLKATLGDKVVGLHWYLTGDDVVYAHLAALHPDSYAVCASHGLFWTAIEMFAGRYRWLDLGGGSGAAAIDDGLTAFKAGWSSDVAPTFLCGKIVDIERYDHLDRSGNAGIHYFPSYRYHEFSVPKDRPSR